MVLIFSVSCQKSNQGEFKSQKNGSNTQSSSEFAEIKSLFDKCVSPSEDTDQNIEKALNLLKELLSETEDKNISNEDILRLSDSIYMHENNDLRIIEYKQLPDSFGNSARASWKVFQYYPYNSAFVIEKNMPYDLQFFRIININNKPILYTYETNHEVNQHKVHIFAYTFNNESINTIDSIDFGNLDTGLWGYDGNRSMLWCKKCKSTYIESVSSDGNEVILKGLSDDAEYTLKLQLTDEGIYVVE